MPKKTAVFLMVFFLVMTAISAPCFCARAVNSNHQVSIQKSHSCPHATLNKKINFNESAGTVMTSYQYTSDHSSESHGCCPSSSQSHCKMHLLKSCSAIGQKSFVPESPELNHKNGADLSVLNTIKIDLTASEIPFIPFSKSEDALFLTNQILRI